MNYNRFTWICMYSCCEEIWILTNFDEFVLYILRGTVCFQLASTVINTIDNPLLLVRLVVYLNWNNFTIWIYMNLCEFIWIYVNLCELIWIYYVWIVRLSGSTSGSVVSVWQCARWQCARAQHCAACVRATLCGYPAVRQCAAVYGSVRQSVAVRAAVCGSALGNVRQCGSACVAVRQGMAVRYVWQCTRLCAAVCVTLRLPSSSLSHLLPSSSLGSSSLCTSFIHWESVPILLYSRRLIVGYLVLYPRTDYCTWSRLVTACTTYQLFS
jgi:hypothetical protein